MSDEVKDLKEHLYPQGDETAWTTAIERIKKLTEENAKLRAENYVLRDQGLRTYDGLAMKADMADELQRKLEIARAALELVMKVTEFEIKHKVATMGAHELRERAKYALKEIGE